MARSFPHRMGLYVSTEEKEEIERKAAALELSVSRYLARAGVYHPLDESELGVVGWEGVATRLEQLFDKLANTNREVRRLQVRVHQIARQIDNQQREGYPAEFDEMNALRGEIGDALESVQAAMSDVAEACP